MLKRIIAAMLSCLLFAAPAFAAGNDMPHRFPDLTESAEIAPDEVMADYLNLTLDDYYLLRERIIAAMSDCAAEVDISDFGIVYDDLSVNLVGSIIYYGDPQFFYFDNRAERTEITPTESGVIGTIRFTYCFDKNSPRYEYYKKKIEESVSLLLDGIEDNDSLTDIQKALLLHDRLAVYCQYTRSYLLNGVDNSSDHTLVGPLVNRECVCQGYAYAYKYLIDMLGIDNYYSINDDHIWNAVYIDGIPYYVDITWDDELLKGATFHTQFLCSYDYFSRSGYGEDFELYDVGNHDEYDNMFWRRSISSFVLLDGEIYYIDAVDCTLNKWVGDEHIKVTDVPGGWNDRNVKIQWVNTYSVLSTDGDYLYYSTPYTIVRFNPRTGAKRTIYTYEPEEGEEFYNIYGYEFDGDTVLIDAHNSPVYLNFITSGKERRAALDVPDIVGDADGDGNVTMKDVLLIRRGLAGAFDLKGKEALCADYDGNGDLNLKDVLAVRKALAGAE